ncbi:MAG: hypothetical protein K0S12_1936 [Bacteroidetes bacterium]|jgi:uncharacterized protein YegJ (DUF2314 family)|nr:hypothetical protein [Bacteroidota bacterium]
MKVFLRTSIVLLLMVSCSSDKFKKKNRTFHASVEEAISPETIAARKEAHQRLSEFDEALLHRQPGYDCFNLKLEYITEEGVEYLWAKNIILDHNSYYGVIDETPELTTEVKRNDSILIPNEKIVDWVFLNYDTLKGGFTIRQALEKMSAEEKRSFFEEYPMVIE